MDNLVTKPFVHSKFDKFIEQNTTTGAPGGMEYWGYQSILNPQKS